MVLLIASGFMLAIAFPMSPSFALTPTTTVLVCTPSTIHMGESSTCTAVVTGSFPTGIVNFTVAANGPVIGFLASCSLPVTDSPTNSCSFKFVGGGAFSTNIVATYFGDSNNAASSGGFMIYVLASTTTKTPTTTSKTATSTTPPSSTSSAAAPSNETLNLVIVGALLAVLVLSGALFVTRRRGRVSQLQSTPPSEPGRQLSKVKRRLAAIMYTDMVGYTALGQRNESMSLALVEEQRKLIRPILARHDGREIKTMGDAFLVEFPNALDAVRCAYDIQRATREFNISLPMESRIHLRVGLHLGDVVESNSDISGDAVNVASRIYPLADDGGVCLSRTVYDLVKNKFELLLTSLGPKSLKNVSEPIEVYRMKMPWES
jgi:class 3 adenylate cyclase